VDRAVPPVPHTERAVLRVISISLTSLKYLSNFRRYKLDYDASVFLQPSLNSLYMHIRDLPFYGSVRAVTLSPRCPYSASPRLQQFATQLPKLR
jgi:hypothetical protein